MYHVISYVFINKSSVITSSSIESYKSSPPNSEQVDSPLLSSSMSLSLLLISDVSIFWHPWHKHPGPQICCLFLQPHLKVLHPFKQLHPFVKNSIFLLIFCCTSAASQSMVYVLLGCNIHPLSWGDGSELKMSGW